MKKRLSVLNAKHAEDHMVFSCLTYIWLHGLFEAIHDCGGDFGTWV